MLDEAVDLGDLVLAQHRQREEHAEGCGGRRILAGLERSGLADESPASAEDVEQEQAGLRGRHEATPVEVAQRAGGLLGTIGRGLVDAALRLRERRESGFFDPAHHRTGQVAARQLADLTSL